MKDRRSAQRTPGLAVGGRHERTAALAFASNDTLVPAKTARTLFGAQAAASRATVWIRRVGRGGCQAARKGGRRLADGGLDTEHELRGLLAALYGPELVDLPVERTGDCFARRFLRHMEPMPPARDLGLVRTDLLGEPASATALLAEDTVERRVVARGPHRAAGYMYFASLSRMHAASSIAAVDEPFGAQLRRVRKAKGLTLEGLAFRTQDVARERGERGLSRDAIAQLEGKPRRRPREPTILLLGEALGAEQGELPAYDLAQGRALLDEYVVGLGVAAANLARVRGVLATAPTAAEREAAEARLRAREREEAQRSAERPPAPPRTRRVGRGRPAQGQG